MKIETGGPHSYRKENNWGRFKGIPLVEVGKRLVAGTRRRPLATLEAFFAIAGGSYGIYQGVSLLDKDTHTQVPPSSSRDIDSFPNSFNDTRLQDQPRNLEQPKPADANPAPKPETKKINLKEVFDNEATTGVITPALREIFTEETIQQLNSFARLENQKTRIVSARELIEELPLAQRKMYPHDAVNVSYEVGENKNAIKILPTILDLSQTSKKDADIEVLRSFSGASIGGDVGEDLFKEKGYFDKFELRMKDGSRIPKGAIMPMFLANEGGGYLLGRMEGIGDRVGETGLLIDLQAPNGNIYRFLVMSLNGEGRNTKTVFLEPLVPAPEFIPEFNRMPVGTYGENVVAGQPILQLSEDADRIAVSLLVSHKGDIGETSRSRPGLSPFVVTNLEMFPSDGNLILQEKSSNNEPISANTQ